MWLRIKNKLKKSKNSDFLDSVAKSTFWDVPTRSKLSYHKPPTILKYMETQVWSIFFCSYNNNIIGRNKKNIVTNTIIIIATRMESKNVLNACVIITNSNVTFDFFFWVKLNQTFKVCVKDFWVFIYI